MKTNLKPLDTSLSEVTTTIQYLEKVNFHDTRVFDIKHKNIFKYKEQVYEIPAADAGHYRPSFLDFPRKLGMFYERHELLGKMFDWFHFRKNLTPDIGFLYDKTDNQTEAWLKPIKPYDFKVVTLDAARTAYKIRHTPTFKDHHEAVKQKLLGEKRTPLSWFIILGAIALVVVAIIVVFSMNNHQAVQTVQNVTASISPSPFTRRP